MTFMPPRPPSSPPSSSGPPFSRPRPSGGFFINNQNRDEHRINERIRVPQVRLIDENGGQVGVIATHEALRMARDRGLDLMEVSPNSQPPVCKICDYGKFKYEKKKKDNQARKKQTVIKVKEVQFRPQTEAHDLEYKFKNVRQFLIDGDKAKISILFRGREIAYADQGHKVMQRLIEHVKDVATVEAFPKLEGRKLIMVLTPAAQKKPQPASKPAVPAKAPLPNGQDTPPTADASSLKMRI